MGQWIVLGRVQWIAGIVSPMAYRKLLPVLWLLGSEGRVGLGLYFIFRIFRKDLAEEGRGCPKL